VCGRVRLSSDVSDIKLVFSIPPHRPTSNTAPSWNVAPTDPLPVVRYDARAGEPSLDVMRWDLVPFWAKDIKVGFSNVNAKAEGIENKQVFREAFQRRRCLVLSITSTSGRSGKTGVRRPTSGCAVLLMSRRRQTNCALSSTTGCPWFWVPRFGRYGWGKSLPTCRV
jgi:hypothetical protein